MKTLMLIRGLPGSGKSTLARQLCTNPDWTYFEADMFFTIQDGSYQFDAKKLPQAHNWCQNKVVLELSKAENNIIVSNTFVRLWEMSEYIKLAERFNYTLQIIECKGNFGSIHNVPIEVIQRMKHQWEELP